MQIQECHVVAVDESQKGGKLLMDTIVALEGTQEDQLGM
jgi:hypothetical protein